MMNHGSFVLCCLPTWEFHKPVALTLRMSLNIDIMTTCRMSACFTGTGSKSPTFGTGLMGT